MVPRPSSHRTWRVEVGGWTALPTEEKDACAAIVSDYGGTTHDGYGSFRRYRTAEVCVRVLREQLRGASRVRLTLSSS